MAEIHQTEEWQRHYLNGFGSEAPEVDIDTTGSDLRIEQFEPDDMHLLRERIAMDKESLDTSAAKIIANETLLRIMSEFFADGEDFHIHSNPELRTFVKECMARETSEVLPDATTAEMVTDDWLEGMLAQVQGFPPHRYEDLEASDTILTPAASPVTYVNRSIGTID